MEYVAPIFKSAAEAKDFPVVTIDSFHWEKEGYSRPESCAALFAVEGEGLHALLWSFEDNIRCECTENYQPVYTDSCLELFIMPVEGDKRYLNVEVNKNGIYLAQLGETRESRTFVKDITALEPVIAPMEIEDEQGKAWGCEIVLTEKFISALYGTDYAVKPCEIKGNFYKCADYSATPHYGAYFPVTTAALGFHNPDCFGKIIIGKV